jgi:phosphatidylinositol glycan class N
VLIGVVWPVIGGKGMFAKDRWMSAFWTLSCLATAVFPLLSVDKNESLLTMSVSLCFCSC